jgi:quercetin dioxygenase-like cupin family protein
MNSHASRIMVLLALTATGFSALSVADVAGPVQASEIKWGPAPPVLVKGAELAVLAGDPAKEGPVTLRLKMPKNYEIAAHWHPTDERVTVISGELGLGMGDKLDRKASKVLKAGGYAIAPAHMNHYAWTKTGTVVQVDLMGPFVLTYVNPADDPSKKK